MLDFAGTNLLMLQRNYFFLLLECLTDSGLISLRYLFFGVAGAVLELLLPLLLESNCYLYVLQVLLVWNLNIQVGWCLVLGLLLFLGFCHEQHETKHFLCSLNLNKKTAIFWELLFDSVILG